LLVDKSGVRGSTLLAQNFTGVKYFHPRPSAAGSNGYDPTSSGGSNLGPTSSNLVANITQNIATYRSDNGLATNAVVPADAVTESASGLDPHISVANAELQIPRVAKARGISEDRVRELVRQNTNARDLGVFGEPRVNVMTLNFALDGLAGK
jgi:K+-transporting ATPase ATPase C chain